MGIRAYVLEWLWHGSGWWQGFCLIHIPTKSCHGIEAIYSGIWNHWLWRFWWNYSWFTLYLARKAESPADLAVLYQGQNYVLRILGTYLFDIDYYTENSMPIIHLLSQPYSAWQIHCLRLSEMHVLKIMAPFTRVVKYTSIFLQDDIIIVFCKWSIFRWEDINQSRVILWRVQSYYVLWVR